MTSINRKKEKKGGLKKRGVSRREPYFGEGGVRKGDFEQKVWGGDIYLVKEVN